MNYNPNKHHRRSIRLKGYDYSKKGLYFITLCCQDRIHHFGEIKKGKMRMNRAGEIVKEEWEKTPLIRDNTALHEFIIMPNHFHAIIEIKFSKNKEGNVGEFKSPSHTIGAIIRGFKGATTKKIKEYYFSKNSRTGESQFAPKQFAPKQFAPTDKIWQRNYYEHIIRSEKSYHNISRYIKNNPANWNKDKFH
ncbi:MAG: transposase [Salibacter sp.]|uniref:transposase n=1 Tax=Salibacter sp. TaxID=2010995 RepID=UPI00286FD08F|nr:transposase [Salibacter sp.]MDR9398201.1 transposase [Salibacter sp.]